MDTNLSGSVALVTGAGRGNGEQIAHSLAKEDAEVVVNDVDSDALENTVAAIEEKGGNAIGIQADVSSSKDVNQMVDKIEDNIGNVNILANNAGIGGSNAFSEISDISSFERFLDTHLYGAINCIHATIESMIDDRYGKIINITSIHTKNGIGMSAEYDVAKFGLLGLTKTLALELGRKGIRVNAVAPGWVNTRMTEKYDDEMLARIMELNPLNRLAEPEEIANAVTFLASPASDYVNGHEFRVDGGQQPIDCYRY